MISFKESLEEIDGLTEYREGVLATWLREQLLFRLGALKTDPIEDSKLVERVYNDTWLGHWGSAIADGEEVAVFECLVDDLEYIESLAYHAHSLERGFIVVEPSSAHQGGYVTYLTPYFTVTPRPRAAAV